MTPRRWLVLEARGRSPEERALLVEGLLALGGRAVREEGDLVLTHVPEPTDPEGFVGRARGTLAAHAGRGDVEVRVSWQDHEEWADTWKRGLAPRRITPRIVVRPSWEAYEPAAGEAVVVLDPGMAFGTAEHGTTRGALRLLDAALTSGERVLDVGAGSGILAVTAALLGAGEAVAVEGDPFACEAAEENVARNGVAGRVTVVRAWADRDSLAGLAGGRPFDGVLANLDGPTLRSLLPALSRAVVHGGWLVLSGIMDSELDELRGRAGGLGLRSGPVDADGEWRSMLLSRGG